MALFKRVCVVGMGYIGLPTSAVFADMGVDVIGVDIRQEIVESINRGEPHIVEPELDNLLRKVVLSGRLKAVAKPQGADAFIISVPTPFKDNHEPDLGAVESATRSIAAVLKAGDLVILESTSPVGTTENVSRTLSQLRTDLSFPHDIGEASDIRVAYCPERVLPGKILHEVINNDRIIGGITPKCTASAIDLYKLFVKGACEPTSARVAEMAKLTENAFRDVNIAFANELSVICQTLKIDVWELIRLANLHPRVNILRPGPGVGGHCIAVDPWFIVAADTANSALIRTARLVNDRKPHFVADMVKSHAERIAKPVIACLGLTYKPNVDDLRESPAIEVVKLLADDKVGELIIVEPHVDTLPKDLADRGLVLSDFGSAITRANILLLLVDHAQFIKPDEMLLNGKVVVDACGAWR